MSGILEGQKVRVILSMCGDYCAFHECNVYVSYDVTNDIQLEDETLEEIKDIMSNNDGGEYCDYQECDAIKIGETYYYKF